MWAICPFNSRLVENNYFIKYFSKGFLPYKKEYSFAGKEFLQFSHIHESRDGINMATIDRFKDILKQGRLPEEQGGQPLTAQTKYDFLAAAHTMDQILELTATLEKRAKKRSSLREKLAATSRKALQKLMDHDDGFSRVKDVDAAINVLTACRTELLALEGEEQSEKALKKIIADGITAK